MSSGLHGFVGIELVIVASYDLFCFCSISCIVSSFIYNFIDLPLFFFSWLV